MEQDQPNIRIGGFSLRIHGRRFPQSFDSWDGNFLSGRALAEAPGASVAIEDAMVRIGEIADFSDQIAQLHSRLSGTARLHCIETALTIEISGDGKGHLTATVHLSPEPLTQKHSLIFQFDQTFLAPILKDLRSVLERYPLRNG